MWLNPSCLFLSSARLSYAFPLSFQSLWSLLYFRELIRWSLSHDLTCPACLPSLCHIYDTLPRSDIYICYEHNGLIWVYSTDTTRPTNQPNSQVNRFNFIITHAYSIYHRINDPEQRCILPRNFRFLFQIFETRLQ